MKINALKIVSSDTTVMGVGAYKYNRNIERWVLESLIHGNFLLFIVCIVHCNARKGPNQGSRPFRRDRVVQWTEC